MTNSARVLALIGFAPSNTDVIPAELADIGMNADDVYDRSQQVAVKTAAIRVMEILLTTADTSDPNTSMAIKYDRAAILKRIDQLKQEIGLTDDAQPTIRGRSAW